MFPKFSFWWLQFVRYLVLSFLPWFSNSLVIAIGLFPYDLPFGPSQNPSFQVCPFLNGLRPKNIMTRFGLSFGSFSVVFRPLSCSNVCIVETNFYIVIWAYFLFKKDLRKDLFCFVMKVEFIASFKISNCLGVCNKASFELAFLFVCIKLTYSLKTHPPF